jgi:glycosyltransferase involved in cell wall biosynthesis
MDRKRFCFVIPRFFEGIAGGAETLLGALAAKLHARGDYVELLATCARDNRTWNNEFPAGESVVAGMRLMRFPVDERNLEAWVPVQCAIHEGKTVPALDQMTWMQESVNSSALYRYLAEQGETFDHIFFGPYLFGTTFWGSQICPAKSVLVPCLHDESYAYLDVIAAMFRNVRGCLFNAAPERELARSLYGDIRGGVVGMGFDLPTQETVSALEPYFEETFPYILYLGRKEMGKNAHTLIDYFCEIKDRGLINPNTKLVILGGGSFSDLHRADAVLRDDVIDLPHVGEREKQRLLRHALYLCQPSTNESFSIVLMEAWMVGTPVVVHGECAVTKHHVVESGGGLYMSSPSDLAGVTRFFCDDPLRRAEFAGRGRDYVEREFSWDAVLDRFDRTLAGFRRHEAEHTPAECSHEKLPGTYGSEYGNT